MAHGRLLFGQLGCQIDVVVAHLEANTHQRDQGLNVGVRYNGEQPRLRLSLCTVMKEPCAHVARR